MKRNNRKEEGGIAVSVLLALGVFLVLLIGLRWNVFLCMGLAAASYAGFVLVLRPSGDDGRAQTEQNGEGETPLERLEEAGADYRRLKKAAEQIHDAQLRGDALKLAGTANSILQYLRENPDKIPSARRYIDYYQETASNILERYVELQGSGLQTKETQALARKTKEAVQTLRQAFAVQLERLMQNKLIDMETDLTVLKQMLRTEGYIDPMERKQEGE